jgi:hypothetical protein
MVSFIKNPMMYVIGPSLSVCHTPFVFLSENMEHQVCSMMENFNGALMFIIYNKYKEDKKFI